MELVHQFGTPLRFTYLPKISENINKAKQWYLDLFAYVIGVIALWMFVDDTLVRAIESVMMVERAVAVSQILFAI